MDKKGYRKLIVWQKSNILAHKVYQATINFPKDEVYGLRSQIRRSGFSIPTNIVEGCGRQNKKELRHFVNIALGSLAEIEYSLNFCYELGYFKKDCYEDLESTRSEVGRLLWKFFKSL